MKKYWGLASDQIDLFANGSSTIGASWPYQVEHAEGREGARARVGVIPKEGVTGLGRHVDALVEGEAPELRLQVDAVHHQRPKVRRPSRRSTSVRRP